MAIFFKEDWDKYPKAIRHTSTKNRSWVRQAVMFQQMGLQNYDFHLALLDPRIEHLDPYDPNLTAEQMQWIKIEIDRNIWYYLREVYRVVPSSGDDYPPLKCNRHVIAVPFLYYNHITSASCIMRQVGKTLIAEAIKSHQTIGASTGTTLLWVTTDAKKRLDTVRGLKRTLAALPDYVYKADPKNDSDNGNEVTNYLCGNVVNYGVGQADPRVAERNGRGYRLPTKFFDEVAETKNAHIIVGAASGSSNAAIRFAKEHGLSYGDVLMCTAGDVRTPEGQFYYNFINSGMIFDERLLYDVKDQKELELVVMEHSRNADAPVVNLTFSWRQMGLTLEEYRSIRGRAIRDCNGDMDKVGREVDSIWTMQGGGNALTPAQRESIKASERDIVAFDKLLSRFIVNWYVTKSELKTLDAEHRLIMGCDTSQGNGRDSCSITFTDAATAAVVGRTDISSVNLTVYIQFVVALMMMFDNSVLIIENKVSGQAVIDGVIAAFQAIGKDPFRRMYNLYHQEPERFPGGVNAMNSVPPGRRSLDFYNSFKGNIGYSTNTRLRQELYDVCLFEAISYGGHTIRDKTLSAQMQSLVRDKGRIDHAVGGNDDAVISYLLTVWFLLFGRNYSRYGIPSRIPLSQAIRTKDGARDEEDVARYERIQVIEEELERLEGMLRHHLGTFYGKSLEMKIEQGYKELEQLGGEPRNLAQLIDDIRKQARRGRR